MQSVPNTTRKKSCYKETEISVTTYRGLLLTVFWHATQLILWGSITLVFSATDQLNMQHRGTQPRFNPRVVYVGFKVYQGTMGQTLLQVLLFSPLSVSSHQWSILTFLSFTDIIWSLKVP